MLGLQFVLVKKIHNDVYLLIHNKLILKPDKTNFTEFALTTEPVLI